MLANVLIIVVILLSLGGWQDLTVVLGGNLGNMPISVQAGLDGVGVLEVTPRVGKYDFRLASGEFIYPGVQCEVYVPDDRLDEYPWATPFSEVLDWSFEQMLGASTSDVWVQVICREVEDSIFMSRQGNFDAYLSWRKTDKWQVWIPKVETSGTQ